MHSLTSWTLESSISIGIYSYRARSCGSSYQDKIGMPHSGWSMYEVGELSMIIASFMFRPSCDMSLTNTPFTKEQCSLKRRFVLYRFGSIWSMRGSAYYIAVKLIIQRFIKYLWKWSSIYHHFIVFGHLLQEVLGSWTFKHVDVADAVVDVNWYGIVRIGYLVELTVDQSFI